MRDQIEPRSDSRQLHRKVLTIYWIVFLLSILAEIVAFIYTTRTNPEDLRDFLVDAVLIPTAIQIPVIVMIEIIHHYKLERPWITLLSGTLIASALIIGNKTLHIQYILLLSMLVSLFYFSIRQLYLAFAMNIAAFAVIYSVFPKVKESTSFFEFSAFVFIMIGMVFILRSVIRRGINILNDHTRMVKSEQELLVRHALMDRMVKVDALTNLYNHKTFHEYLEMLIEQSNNNAMPLQLAVMDIDNFKSVNDTFGHAIGDIILTRVAKVLSDLLVQNEIVARYGGEEFAVIFPGASLSEAYTRLEEVRVQIEQLLHPEMDGRKVTISIGLTEHQGGISSSNLFTKTDSLLYEAKRSGKNKTVMCGRE